MLDKCDDNISSDNRTSGGLTRQTARSCGFIIHSIVGRMATMLLFLSFLGLVLLSFLSPITTDDYSFFKTMCGISLYDAATGLYFGWGGAISNYIILWMGFQNSATDLLLRVANGILTVFVVYLGACCIEKKRLQLWSDSFLVVFFFVWFAMPVRGETLFWRVGSAPYLWSLFYSVLPLLPFFFEKNWGFDISTGFITKTCLFCCALLAGWAYLQSSFASFFAVSVFLIMQYRRRIRTASWQKVVWFGLFTGLILLLVAPGNYVRLGVFGTSSQIRSTITGKLIALLFYYCRIFGVNEYSLDFIPFVPLLIIIVIAAYITGGFYTEERKCFPFLTREPIDLFLLMAAGSLLIVVPLAGTSTRAGSTALFYFVLWLLGRSKVLWNKIADCSCARLLLAGCLLLNISLGVVASLTINGQLVAREAAIRQQKENGASSIVLAEIFNQNNPSVFFEDEYPLYAPLYGVDSITIEPVQHPRFTFSSAGRHIGSIKEIFKYCLNPVFYRR